MQLSKLEIKGFKSFGEKVTIHFDKGVTAVVGPNGSGKSNVVDAIRWVLGEQSTKALRSDKMENVIFNGTRRRKPLQLAEVTMTFVNNRNLLPTEYTEVAITRRYYRSGDGEYLLNGVTCRLKDIVDLFLDTGIGSDSYSIIELKMVDELLNDTNNSRRELFEEAAGISKFKKRKKETMRKLSEADADLERVEDLLHEVLKNVRSLERQAKQAERYMLLKKAYREASIALARRQTAARLTQLDELVAQLEAQQQQRQRIAEQSLVLEEAQETGREALQTKQDALQAQQRHLSEHAYKTQQLENERKVKAERQRYLLEKRTTLQQQIEEDTLTQDQLSVSISSLEQQLRSAERLMAEAEELLGQYQQRSGEQERRLQEQRAVGLGMENKIRTAQNELLQQQKTLELHELQVGALRQELEREHTLTQERSESTHRFADTLKELERERYGIQDTLQRLEEQELQRTNKVTLLQAQVEQLRERMREQHRQLDAKQHEYKLTKSMVDNLEGYPEAIKYLKQHADIAKDAPMLGDILGCEPKYRLAIEAYLEPYLNYFILESEEQAWTAVNMLLQAKKGKANFLLLDKFPAYKPVARKAFPHAEPALDVVECSEKYATLITYLLDNVYIVTHNQHELPKDDSVIFVTQNGRFIRRRFALSGGEVGIFEGKKIGRAHNLEKLGQEIEALQEQLKGEEQELEGLRAQLQEQQQASYQPEITHQRERLNILDQQLVRTRTQQEELERFLAESSDRKQDLIDRKLASEDILEKTRPAYESLKEELEILQESFEELRDQLQDATDQLAVEKAALSQQQMTFYQQQSATQSMQQERNMKETTLIRAESRLKMNAEELAKIQDDIRYVQDADEHADSELERLQEERQALEQQVQQAERDYQQHRTQLQELEQQIRNAQRQREQLDNHLLQLNQTVGELRLSLVSAREKILAEFEVDLEQLNMEDGDAFPEVSDQDLSQQVSTLKGQLQNLGAINHTAIDAFEEVKERHRFILEQRDDLIKAKESLILTISEIDTVAREQFMNAFTLIRTNFIEVFRSLFSEEDNCDLTLLNEDDPLDSKIEVFAQPKGKRPLTINQLSGGEKTLTATALLFSIYLLKPAPFCIFDEVDAPLDDANVDKFTKIIQKFSANSQFIIVTHNKRTMASTDIIYGVTMIEEGVTTVVPVDMRATPDFDIKSLEAAPAE